MLRLDGVPTNSPASHLAAGIDLVCNAPPASAQAFAPVRATREAPAEAAAWSGRALPVAGRNLPLEARLGEARLAYMLLAELGA